MFGLLLLFQSRDQNTMFYLWMIFHINHEFFQCNINMKYLIFLSNLNYMLKIYFHPTSKCFNLMVEVNILKENFKMIWLIMVLDFAPLVQVIPNKMGLPNENIVTLLTVDSHFLPMVIWFQIIGLMHFKLPYT